MSKMVHDLFMIAVEGTDFVVTATCRYVGDENNRGSISFTKCVYEVRIPKDTAETMTVDEMFQEAKKVFRSVKGDF